MSAKTTAPVTPTKPRFAAALHYVENRGRAPLAFLEELLAWGNTAPEEIFAPNRVPNDAYAVIKPFLGTQKGEDDSGTPIYVWESLLHRRAAMLELMRVHAGLESSWKWGEGVDKTNPASQKNKAGEETGIFQVSFDSTYLDSAEGKDIMAVFLKANGKNDGDPAAFIKAMKGNHVFAMEYYARLVRVSIRWAGPLLRPFKDSVYPNLSKDSMREFMRLLDEK